MAMLENEMKVKMKKMRLRAVARMEKEHVCNGRCLNELNVTHMQDEEIYQLYEHEARSPPPLDNNIFQVSESIIQHHRAISTHRYINEILNLYEVSEGEVPRGGDGVDMGEDEGHEPAPNIPPDKDKEEKPLNELKINGIIATTYE